MFQCIENPVCIKLCYKSAVQIEKSPSLHQAIHSPMMKPSSKGYSEISIDAKLLQFFLASPPEENFREEHEE